MSHICGNGSRIGTVGLPSEVQMHRTWANQGFKQELLRLKQTAFWRAFINLVGTELLHYDSWNKTVLQTITHSDEQSGCAVFICLERNNVSFCSYGRKIPHLIKNEKLAHYVQIKGENNRSLEHQGSEEIYTTSTRAVEVFRPKKRKSSSECR